MSRSFLSTLLGAGLLAGCDAEGEAQRGDDLEICPGGGESRVFAVHSLYFSRITDGASAGFNLDEAVTEPGGSTGCGKADVVGLDGEPGVDNAFAGLLPVLETTEAQALEPLIQDQIDGGEILLLIEVSAWDGADQDDCVGVQVLRGDGVPAVGNDGLLLADQTYTLTAQQPMAEPVRGRVVDGQIQADELTFALPVTVFDADLPLEVRGASMRLDPREDSSASALLGGAFPWVPMVEALQDTNIDNALEALLPGLVGGVADMAPDASGQCQEISVTLDLGLANGFLFRE